MDAPVPTSADRRTVSGLARGGTFGGMGHRGASAAPSAAAGGFGGGGRCDAFARVLAETCAGPERTADPGLLGAGLTVGAVLRAARTYGRSDGPRNGRPPYEAGAAMPGAVPVGRRVDVAV